MQKVDVFLTGQLLQGAEPRASALRLAALARIDEALALQMLQSGRMIRIKKGVDAALGIRYQRALTAIGVEVRLAPVKTAQPCRQETPLPHPASGGQGKAALAKPRLGPGRLPAPPSPAPVVPARVQAASPAGEPAFFSQLQLATKSIKAMLSQVPGRPPSRGLAVALPSGPKTRRSKQWLSTPRVVPARQGWDWLCQAWQMFREAPCQWLLLFWLSCSLLGLVLVAPNAHLFLLVLFLPLFFGMYMGAAHRQNQDEPLKLFQSVLFAARNWKSLLLFGLLSLILLLFAGASFFFLSDTGFFLHEGHAATPALLPQEQLPFVLFAVLVLFPGIPMLSGYAFTIPLVLFAELRPIHAFQLGVYGCIRNWKAVLLAFALSAPFLVFGIAVLKAIHIWLPWLYWPLATLILLALAPPMVVMAVLLVYHAFHDIFAIAAERES